LFAICLLLCVFRVSAFPDTTDAGYPLSILAKFTGLPAGFSLDAAFYRKSNGRIYFFSGSQYWRLNDKYVLDQTGAIAAGDAVDAGYPQNIADKWGGVPDDVDAVFQRDNGKIYFFKGGEYYRVTDKYLFDLTADSVDAGYPQAISAKWTGVPDDVDAAFQRTTTAHIYFFKGSEYYRVTDKYIFADDPTTVPDTVDTGYPKDVATNWVGLPATGIDAAFQRGTNQKIYAFWSPDMYARISDKYLFSPVDAYCPPATTTPAPSTCPECETCPTSMPDGGDDDGDEGEQGGGAAAVVNVNFANIFNGMKVSA